MLRRARIRSFCTKAKEGVRGFDEIPGPRSVPIIGTLHKYLPVIGEYNFKKLHKNGAKNYAKYGPLVRENIVPSEPIVWVFRPEDIAEVFKADTGLHPERRSHRALCKYRLDRPELYNNGGLLPTNGPEWWRLRREFQKDLSKPQAVANYIADTDAIITEFVEKCAKNEHEDLLPLLSRLYLELICLVAFDFKANSFSEQEMKPDSMTSKLIDSAFNTNSAIVPLDSGPQLWRFFETPLYKKLRKAQDFMSKIAFQLVSEKVEKMKNSNPDEKESLLETYLRNPNLDFKDVVGMASDMLLAGIDTTTYTSAFALYHLGKNPETLEKLYAESSNLIIKETDKITANTLKEATYTKAVLKETFRLNPIAIGVGRIMQKDIVLNGYHVPKGTNVVTQNQVSCRLPQYFKNPDSFIPERWIRNSDLCEKSSIHPYLVLPFGHGPRSCIARRLAEQQIQILLLRLCRHLKFNWTGGELDVDSFLINKPNGPINLQFYHRT